MINGSSMPSVLDIESKMKKYRTGMHIMLEGRKPKQAKRRKKSSGRRTKRNSTAICQKLEKRYSNPHLTRLRAH